MVHIKQNYSFSSLVLVYILVKQQNNVILINLKPVIILNY